MIHVYYGDGKGKTCSASGAAMRAAGAGFRVLFYQFMKDGSSSEVKALSKVEGLEVMSCSVKTPFLDEKLAKEYVSLYACDVSSIVEKALSGTYGMVVLDEALDALNLGLFPRTMFEKMLDMLPSTTELVLTGHEYKGQSIGWLLERADYVTRFVKESHPFDSGTGARRGIEL